MACGHFPVLKFWKLREEWNNFVAILKLTGFFSFYHKYFWYKTKKNIELVFSRSYSTLPNSLLNFVFLRD